MLDLIAKEFPIAPNVRGAMSQIPRDIFMTEALRPLAYRIDAISIGANQFISSPLTVAKMTQFLEIDKSCDSVLEIGCGSGYQAAILSKLFRRVFSIERIERLREEAIVRFKKLGIMNVNTKVDDGNNGWEKYAPFDRILFSASPSVIAPKVATQLAEGGILVAPMTQNDGTQIITRFIKRHGRLNVLDTKGECEFVPVKRDIER
ncbi:protein-L-isoaspartate(D-aspartate) O-methyltransferase [Helicobacter sp. 23-1045]